MNDNNIYIFFQQIFSRVVNSTLFSRSPWQEGRRLRWSNLRDYSGSRRRATFRTTKKRTEKNERTNAVSQLSTLSYTV